jgi:hypothetical protein
MATESMSRTKHIAIKQMAVTAYFKQGDIDLQYVPTDDNPADHFTKPLGAEKFTKHANTIMGSTNNNQFTLSKPLTLRHARVGGTNQPAPTRSIITTWENSNCLVIDN